MGAEHGQQRRLLAAEEVGGEHLDARAGQAPAQRPDRPRPVLGAAILEVVAVDGRHDDVAEAHALGGGGSRPGSSGSSGSPRLAELTAQ